MIYLGVRVTKIGDSGGFEGIEMGDWPVSWGDRD